MSDLRRLLEAATPETHCGRFYAPREPFDYRFCYLPKGHLGECVFEKRRRTARLEKQP